MKCGSEATFTTLSRQALTAPYALYAPAAGSAPWSGVTGIPAGFADGVDNVSVVVSGTNIFAGTGLDELTNGDNITLSVAVPYRLPQACGNGQIAKWNGATWACADDSGGAHDHWGASWSGTGTGLTLSGGSIGLAASGSTYGISGTTPSGTGIAYGVYGQSGSRSGYGVYGGVSSTTGVNYGVYGQVASPNGWAGSFNTSVGNGVYITAPNGTGLNVASGVALVAGNPIWHAGNDGPGSGLNADLLDGQHGSSYWMLGGNSVAADAVLGTTSDYALDIFVHNQRAFRIEPNASSPNVIGGYSGNTVTGEAHGATIGGGGFAGHANQVAYDYGTIGGGISNTVGYGDTVGGGSNNTVSGSYSTIGGGANNTVSDSYSTIGGGYYNMAGYEATVGGGYGNTASGLYATVSGGYGNTASGDFSFAAGHHAINTNITHDGVFLFADSNDYNFYSTAANQFRVRSTGGAQFVTAIDGSGTTLAGVEVASGGGSWSSLSDRNLKANFATVDGRAVLATLAATPIQTWNYIAQDDSIRHIGPMAQDFYAAFNVGEDNTHIATIDADGVALAAIQGLNEIVQEKDVRIAALEEHNAALEARLTALEQLAQTDPASARGDMTGNIGLLVIGALLGIVVIQKPWQRRTR